MIVKRPPGKPEEDVTIGPPGKPEDDVTIGPCDAPGASRTPPGAPEDDATIGPPVAPREGRPANAPAAWSSEDLTIGPVRPGRAGAGRESVAPGLRERGDEAPRPDMTGLTAEQEGRYIYRQASGKAWTKKWSAGAVIGRGGQSAVRAAFDRHLGREVAVKELAPPPGGNGGRLSATSPTVIRFLREARVTGQLEHPGIIPVYELGERPDGTLYYSMKLIRGRTFRSALDECKSLTDRLRLLPHFLDVCQAVAYAHSRGVVHRDIKPANIMVGEFGETLLFDWGLAKLRGQPDEFPETAAAPGALGPLTAPTSVVAGSEDTLQGAVMGTPGYMSPEQAAGDVANVDERSGVWALGAMLYEILTNQPPFRGRDGLEKVRVQAVPPVRELCPEAPQDLAAVATKALCREACERYRNARELAAEIESFLAGARIKAYEYTLWELVRRYVAAHRTVAIATAAVLALMIVGSIATYVAWQKNLQARRNERLAHMNLTAAYLEKSGRELAESDYGRAKIFASAALLHNPFNPYSAYALPAKEKVPAGMAGLQTVLISNFYETTVKNRLIHEAVLRGHQDVVRSLDFSADGNWLASGASDRSIRVWSMAEGDRGRLISEHEDAHTGRVWKVAFSPVDGRLASAGEDGVVRIWKPPAPTAVLELRGHSGQEVTALAWSPDGRVLASGGHDKNLVFWDAATGQQIARLASHGESVSPVVFSPDGAYCASAGNDGEIVLWKLGGDLGDTTPQRVSQNPPPISATVLDRVGQSVKAIAFSPDGSLLAAGSFDSKLRIYDVRQRKLLLTQPAHQDAIFALAFAPDGRHLATASRDDSIKIWSVPEWKLTETIKGGAAIQALAFSPDGALLATAGYDHLIHLWRPSFTADIDRWRGPGKTLICARISPAGDRLAAAFEKEIFVWSVGDASPPRVLTGHNDLVWSLAFSPDGQRLVSAGADGRVLLWPLDGEGPPTSLVGHAGKALTVSYSPDGSTIASGGKDQVVHLWDAGEARETRRLGGHAADVMASAFSPDGRFLATGDKNHVIILWDVGTGRERLRLTGHSDWITRLAFSPDGQLLLSASRDQRMKLWRVADGALQHTLEGHDQYVNDVSFSPDGARIISGSDDKTARLWDVKEGRQTQTIPQHGMVTFVSFLPDGKFIAVNDGSTIQLLPQQFDLWRQNPATLLHDAERDAGLTLNGLSLAPEAAAKP